MLQGTALNMPLTQEPAAKTLLKGCMQGTPRSSYNLGIHTSVITPEQSKNLVPGQKPEPGRTQQEQSSVDILSSSSQSKEAEKLKAQQNEKAETSTSVKQFLNN